MASTIVDRTGSSSSSAEVNRLTGLAASASVKGPCRTLSLTAITLSGEQTVASVAVVTGDRVLVGGQTDDTANGIYLVSTGAWQRAPDWNRSDDVMDGTLILVTGGDNSRLWQCVAETEFVDVGTDGVAFAATLEGAMGDAIHTATAVTTVDDTDEIGFWDSTLATMVRITFANFRTKLATLFLPLAGGTLTGDVIISKVNPQLYVKKSASGEASNIWGMNGATARWLLSLGTTTAEAGSNAGSDLAIGAYDDAGAAIDVPMTIGRAATGIISLVRNLAISKTTPTIVLNKPSALSDIALYGTTGNVARWGLFLGSNSAESGADAGSSFVLAAYSDAGSYVDSPIVISRASTGQIQLTRGIDLQNGQIAFPASQNAVAAANTLDDYEEGTYTPTFIATGATFSYASQSGNYTKVGNNVSYNTYLQLKTAGNTLTANALTSGGSPFTFSAGGPDVVNWGGSTTSYIAMNSVLVIPGGTTWKYQGNTAAATSNQTQPNSNALLAAATGSNVNWGGFAVV